MKAKIICGILALLMVTVGVVSMLDTTPQSYTGEDPFTGDPSLTLPEDVTVDDLVSTLDEKPDGATVQDYLNDFESIKKALYICAGELKRAGGFQATAEGASTSMGINQAVYSKRTVVGENASKEAITLGAMSFAEQLYVCDGRYLSRSPEKIKSKDDIIWQDKAYGYTEGQYLGKIGYVANGLTAYVLNDLTIIDATYEGKTEDGMYQFRYVLDIETAPFFMLYEMRNNSGSGKFGTFSKIELVITMDDNFVIQTLTTDCAYSAYAKIGPVLISADCTESITETFFDMGYNGELLNSDFFENAEVEGGTDAPKEKTALDVLMGLFAPYLDGETLDATISVGTQEKEYANMLVSLKGLNMSELTSGDLSNLSVDAKIGDLYVTYKKNLFVTYQDFKAQIDINELVKLIGGLLPESTGSGLSFDTEKLLADMSFEIDGSKCSVTIPITLGDIAIEAKLFGTYSVTKDEAGKDVETYTFTGATATIGDICIEIEPTRVWQAPSVADTTKYPSLSDIADQLIDESAIILNAKVLGISCDVAFDVPTMTLVAQAKELGLDVTLLDSVLYASLGDAKVKFDLDDINTLIELIKPLLGDSIQLPQISVSIDDVLQAIGNIATNKTEKGVDIVFAMESLGLEAKISFEKTENGLKLGGIYVKISDFDITISPTKHFEVEKIENPEKYVDVTDVAGAFIPKISELLNASGYAIGIDGLTLKVGDTTYTVKGSVVLDENMNVQVVADVLKGDIVILKANVIVVDDVLYLDVNGIKLAVALGSGDNAKNATFDVASLGSYFDSALVKDLLTAVQEVIDKFSNFTLDNLNIGSIIDGLTYDSNNKELTLKANLDVFALGEVELTVSAKDNLAVTLTGYKFAGLTLGLTANVATTENEFTIGAPTEDYTTKLGISVTIGDGKDAIAINGAIALDLLKLGTKNANVAWGQISVFNTTVDVLVKDNVVYLACGGAKLKLALSNINELIEQITSLVGGTKPTAEGGNDASFSLDQLLEDLTVSLKDGLNVSLSVSGMDIAVSLNEDGISATVGDSVTALVTATTQVNCGLKNTTFEDREFIDVVELLGAYGTKIKDLISAKGYEIGIDGLTLKVGDTTYKVEGTVKLNRVGSNISAVEVDAEVFKNGIGILKANVIVVDDVLYLDVNGIKLAVALNSGGNDFDLSGLTETLGKLNIELVNNLLAKVDSVVEAIKAFDVTTLDVGSLISELSFADGKLTVNANLSSFELGNISVVVSSEEVLSVAIDEYTFAGITLGLDASVKATDATVPVPNTSDYVLNLTGEVLGVRVHLSADIYNMIIQGQIDYGDTTAYVKFVDDTVFVKLGNNTIKLTLAEVMDIVGEFVDVDSAIDLSTILNKVSLNLAEEQPSISIALDGFAVAINFERGNDITFKNIALTVNGKTSEIVPTSTVATCKVDTANATSVKGLVDDVVALVNQYLGLSNGLGLLADGEIQIGDETFTISATVNYNGGLYVKVTVANATTNAQVIVADVYYVDKTFYVDLNGIRVAANVDSITEFIAQFTDTATAASENGDTTFDTVLALLKNNKQLEDVVTEIENVMKAIDGIKDINLASVLSSLSVDKDGKWTIVLDGTVLGLSKGNENITLTLDGDNVGISGIKLGSISVNSLSATLGNADEVKAPTEDYVTSLGFAVKIGEGEDAIAIDGAISLDLLKLGTKNANVAWGQISVFNTTVDVLVKDNVVYLACGGAKLKLALSDIGTLIEQITNLVGGTKPASEGDDDVLANLIQNLSITAKDGLNVTLPIGSVNVTVAFNENAKLEEISVTGIDKVSISVTQTSSASNNIDGENFDSSKFVDVVELLDAYGTKIKELISANGYNISANGTITLGNHNYGIDLDVLLKLPTETEQLSLAATATISFNGINILEVNVWMKNNMLYATVNGLKIAVELSENSGTAVASEQSLADTLAPLYGYNDYLDVVLDAIKNVVGSVDTLNVNALASGLTFDANTATLTATLNGAQFGLSEFVLSLASSETELKANVQNLSVKNVTLNLSASVNTTTANVDVPSQDWRTDIIVKLDGANTLYGRLDLIKNSYDFKLVNTNSTKRDDDAFCINYSNGSFKVKKGTDIKVIGNIDAIKELVEKIDEIVKAFAGETAEPQSEETISIDTAKIKEIVQSLSISTATDGETVVIALDLFGMPVSIELADRNGPTIVGISITIDMLSKEFVALPNIGEDVTYGEFTNTDDYIAIEEVLDDFMPYIDNLIRTNCWRFDFNSDSTISIKNEQNVSTVYAIAAGSYFEFFYNRNNPADLTICARLTLKEQSGSSWIDLCTIDVVYTEGRIYVTYNETLRITIAIQSIKDCAGAFEDLQDAIPQIAELIAAMQKAMNDVENNVSNLDYTTILESVTYLEETAEGSDPVKVFAMVINGGVLLNNLGDITLVATNEHGTLTLRELSLSYDSVSITLSDVSVKSVEQITTVEEGATRTPSDYKISNDVNTYFATNGTEDKHISFDSLQHLMQAVADTARKDTFAIDGVITAVLDLSSVSSMLGGVAKATVPVPISIRVDIVRGDTTDDNPDNDEDEVFIAVVLTRYNTKAKILGIPEGVYNDEGGRSYLTYDSTYKYTETDENGKESEKNGWFTVSRYPYSYQKNSTDTWKEIEVYDYCTDCGTDATDNCYVKYCNQCGKTGDDTEQCKVDWCSKCNKEAQDSCYVDWCTKCQCEFGTGNCSHRTSYYKTKAHGDKVTSAHGDQVRDPHFLTTLTREIVHEGGEKPYITTPDDKVSWSGNTTQFTSEQVKRGDYTISRLENELYDMLNLGKLALNLVDLEDIIISQIHKEDSATDASTENLLSNLQKIFLNYEYIEPTTLASGITQDPYFHVTADLAPINKDFGVLDVSIGHTYAAIADELTGLADTQLNLTYVKGSWILAQVVTLSFNLTLQQDASPYTGDAQYFVQNGIAWDPLLHASDYQGS